MGTQTGDVVTTTTHVSVDTEPAQKVDPAPTIALRAYLLAIVVTASTFLLRWMLGFVIGDLPVLILFVIPIAISSYVGGLGPGLLATGLGALGSLVFLLPPNSFNSSGLANGMLWIMLVVAGVVVSFFSELLHRSR